jgi:inosine/xanthosine triphosphate pyrophosphatase family protein
VTPDPGQPRIRARVYLASQNAIKLEEARRIFADVAVIDLELEEIQSPDPLVVVTHKLDQVLRAGLGVPVVVEDTGLAVRHWGTLPGALIKWFVEELGPSRLADVLGAGLAAGAGAGAVATATSAVGAACGGKSRLWAGSTPGRIVAPRGCLGGWTPVFEVAGTGKTLAEMTLDERMAHTMRAEPFRLARAWLGEQDRDGRR